MYNVQKHNNCINIQSSETFRHFYAQNDDSDAMFIYTKNQDNIKKNKNIFKSCRTKEKSILHITWS
jgi:hypothetical protein